MVDIKELGCMIRTKINRDSINIRFLYHKGFQYWNISVQSILHFHLFKDLSGQHR